MNSENDYKKKFKPPVCLRAPWEHLVKGQDKDTILRKIRQESIEAYGESYDQCPKRKVCFTQSCMGRPLPWKSETAKPYLEQLKQTHTITNDELFINNCNTCDIAKTCKSPCPQVNDWMNRHKDQEMELVYQETLDNHIIEEAKDSTPALSPDGKIPWDCLSETRKQVVQKYMFEQKDFLTISKELNLNNQARCKYEFYAALTKMSEYAAVRLLLETDGQEIKGNNINHYNILNDIYVGNQTIVEVAKNKKVSKQSIQQTLTKILVRYNVKWHTFVKKQGNKVVYNIPMVLK